MSQRRALFLIGLCTAVCWISFVVFGPSSHTAQAAPLEQPLQPPTAAERASKMLNQVTSLEFSHRSLLEITDDLRARTGLAFELDGKLTPAKIHNSENGPPADPEGPAIEGYSCSLENMKLRTALQVFLGHYGLDFAVLDGTITIATAERARELQVQQPIDLVFEKTSLTMALSQLARQSATDIFIDPRAVKNAEKPLSMRLEGMPLEKAVSLLAEFAGLKAVPWGKAFVVTTAEHAAQLRTVPHAGKKEEASQPRPQFGGFSGFGSGISGFGTGQGLGFVGGGFSPMLDTGPIRRTAEPAIAPVFQKKKSPKRPPNPLREALADTIETKDFENPMTLREALALLQQKYTERGKELPMLLDAEAFRAENSDHVVSDTQIQFPPYPKRMSLATALRVILGQIRTDNATYVVRPTYLEITTFKRAQPEAQTIEANFVERPLNEALAELSELTGISIVVDSRVGPRAATAVTAAFHPDTSLLTATQLLADMADLKVMVVDNLLYVTRSSNSANFPPARPDRKRDPVAAQ